MSKTSRTSDLESKASSSCAMKFNVHSGNNAAISEKSTSDERKVKLFGIINAVDRSRFTQLLFEKSFRRNNDQRR